MAESSRLTWSGTRGLYVEPAHPEVPPRVVDSWLVEQGRARGLTLHRERFFQGCEDTCREVAADVDEFFGAVAGVLPRSGRWFPRVEAYESSLRLWLRPAPALRAQTVVWIPPLPDPRLRPRLKGPDLELLGRLRDSAGAMGADDALLWAPDGTALETAHSALVWWRNGVLYLPRQDLPVLSSVTVALLLDLADRAGIGVERGACSVSELGNVEAWTANALHGLAPVSAWITDGSRIAAHAAGSSGQRLSEGLSALAEPLGSLAWL